MKCFVLTCRFAGIRFALWFRLSGIGRHRVWVVSQFFFDLELQHCAERAFVGTGHSH